MKRLALSIMVFAAFSAAATTTFGQGMILTGVGPINRSMGGAGTAAPLDAIGALHWNPGSISALPTSQISYGLEGLAADVKLSTTIGGVSNTTTGDAGIVPIPTVGWVHHIEDTRLTIGLGVYGVAGFRNAIGFNANDPILSQGPLFADAELLQIAPTVSYAFTDHLSIGIAPTITTARLMMDPLGPSVITPVPTPGTGTRVHWGAGFQVGAFYTTDSCWQFGFTYKSQQWFEQIGFMAPTGTIGFNLDYPSILSTGIAYRGFSRWVFATDVRYITYQWTEGFDKLGWRNVWAVATGAQYQLSEMISLRVGYNANQNPIQSEDVFTNISTPLIQDQNIATGLTCKLTQNVDLALAYVYLMQNSVTGDLPAGVFGPNATLTNQISAHSIGLGMTLNY